MALPAPFIVWQVLPGKFSGPLRLLAAPAGVTLFQSATAEVSSTTPPAPNYQAVLTPTILSAAPASGTTPPTVALPQLLPSIAAFDVALADGQTALTIESFGGAVNALLVGSVADGKFKATATYDDFNSYDRPRFVRGGAVPPGRYVSAIVDDQLVVLSGKPAPRASVTATSAPYTVLSPARDGVVVVDGAPPSPQNGTLPPDATLSLFLRVESGEGPPSPSGDFPGTAFLQGMASGKAAPPSVLFAEGGSYALDADAQSGVALVVAVTAAGPQLLSCALPAGTATAIPWPTDLTRPSGWIANPSAVAIPGAAGAKHFALAFYVGVAVANDRITAGGIGYAELDLAQLP
jgi:hypothetical protein